MKDLNNENMLQDDILDSITGGTGNTGNNTNGNSTNGNGSNGNGIKRFCPQCNKITEVREFSGGRLYCVEKNHRIN